CLDPCQIFKGPDYPRRTAVQAGVAVGNSLIERMRRPKPLDVEMTNRIQDDFFKRLGGLIGTPRQSAYCDMTRRFEHKFSLSLNVCSQIIAGFRAIWIPRLYEAIKVRQRQPSGRGSAVDRARSAGHWRMGFLLLKI